MAEVQEFENVESGASLTYPAAAGSIRKGAHIVIKGRPCKVGFFSSTRLCLAWVFTFVQVPRCVPVYFIFLLLSLSLSLSLHNRQQKPLLFFVRFRLAFLPEVEAFDPVEAFESEKHAKLALSLSLSLTLSLSLSCFLFFESLSP